MTLLDSLHYYRLYAKSIIFSLSILNCMHSYESTNHTISFKKTYTSYFLIKRIKPYPFGISPGDVFLKYELIALKIHYFSINNDYTFYLAKVFVKFAQFQLIPLSLI